MSFGVRKKKKEFFFLQSPLGVTMTTDQGRMFVCGVECVVFDTEKAPTFSQSVRVILSHLSSPGKIITFSLRSVCGGGASFLVDFAFVYF